MKKQVGDFDGMKLLSPRKGALNIVGTMTYSEGNQAWSVMRLKKELLHEFPQLKEKREQFLYKMIIHRSLEGLKNEIDRLDGFSEEVVPVLLFFGKGKKQ